MPKFMSLTIPMLAASLLLAACGSSSKQNSAESSRQQAVTESTPTASGALVKTAQNSSLGATILVDSQGMTLYRLSGEQNGKFICTSSRCVGVWHPLLAPSAGTPGGVESLGTVKRPNGTEQVTYKGMPLYTFVQDMKPGDVNGQGIKDVGTWSAVSISSSSSSSSTSGGAAPSGGGGYGY